jgi:hypothetical protein
MRALDRPRGDALLLVHHQDLHVELVADPREVPAVADDRHPRDLRDEDEEVLALLGQVEPVDLRPRDLRPNDLAGLQHRAPPGDTAPGRTVRGNRDAHGGTRDGQLGREMRGQLLAVDDDVRLPIATRRKEPERPEAYERLTRDDRRPGCEAPGREHYPGVSPGPRSAGISGKTPAQGDVPKPGGDPTPPPPAPLERGPQPGADRGPSVGGAGGGPPPGTAAPRSRQEGTRGRPEVGGTEGRTTHRRSGGRSTSRSRPRWPPDSTRKISSPAPSKDEGPPA